MICICIHTLQSINFSFWNDLEKLAELGNKSAPSSSDKLVPCQFPRKPKMLRPTIQVTTGSLGKHGCGTGNILQLPFLVAVLFKEFRPKLDLITPRFFHFTVHQICRCEYSLATHVNFRILISKLTKDTTGTYGRSSRALSMVRIRVHCLHGCGHHDVHT